MSHAHCPPTGWSVHASQQVLPCFALPHCFGGNLTICHVVYCSAYSCLLDNDMSDFKWVLQAIEELPGQESPEIFGLHPNADLTFRTLQVQAGVQIIMDTQPKGAGGGGGLSREEIVDRICEDLLSKVCSDTFFYNSFHLLFICCLCWQTCTHYIWQYQVCFANHSNRARAVCCIV